MAQELGDLAELGELARLEAQLVQTLAEEDVDHLAAAMDPGSVAGVLVYENLWAAPFASAMRRAGGQLIANGRIPIQAIIAAVEADAALEAARSLTCRSDQVAEASVSSARPSPRPPSSAPPSAPARRPSPRRRSSAPPSAPAPRRSPRPPSSARLSPRPPPLLTAGSRFYLEEGPMKRPIGITILAIIFLEASFGYMMLGFQITTAVTFGPAADRSRAPGSGAGWLVLTGLAFWAGGLASLAPPAVGLGPGYSSPSSGSSRRSSLCWAPAA